MEILEPGAAHCTPERDRIIYGTGVSPGDKMRGDFSLRSRAVLALQDGEGSPRVVGPVIKEGVWNGIYVPASAIREAHLSLLGRYWLNLHPLDGTEVEWHESAMGIVLGETVSDDEGAETVVEIEPWPDRIPDELYARLESGEKLGTSVHFFAQYDNEEGEFGGVPYTQKVTRMYYTHVARVPTGACSVEDGCFTQMAFESIRGSKNMTENKEKVPLADEDDGAGAGEESEVVILAFNHPDDVAEFVADAIDKDDPAEGMELMTALGNWVVENWRQGSGPFLAPITEERAEPMTEKTKLDSVAQAKKKDKGEEKTLSPARSYMKRKLMGLMPSITEERFEEVYEGVDEGSLVAILEDLETVLAGAEAITEEIEAVTEEIEGELGTEAQTNQQASVAQARKPATKIKVQRRASPPKNTYKERKLAFNRDLGVSATADPAKRRRDK